MKSNFTNPAKRHESGRYLSLVLRELAPTLGCNVDKFGFIALEDVLSYMLAKISDLTAAHIIEIVEKDPQHRFEIKGDKIRAKAGHRYNVEVPWSSISPPEFLYHGTSPESIKEILEHGILRMGKAYVHLSDSIERAVRIGLRKSPTPKIIIVKARLSHEAGIRFWQSGQVSSDGEIYLSDEVPPEFLELCSDTV